MINNLEVANARENVINPNLIVCKQCGAKEKQACINPRTGAPYRHESPHIVRIIQTVEENR